MEASGATPPNTLLAPAPGQRRRRVVNRAVEVSSTFAAVVAVAVLLLVVISVLVKGLPAISFGFIFHDPKTSPFGGNTGGIANAVVGTLILIALATAMAVPLAILIAIYTTEFAPPSVSNVIRFSLDLLNGVPTIVVGVFIFGVMVVGSQQSGWAGAVALAIVELPIVARSSQEVLLLVPRSLKEAGLALGLKRWRIVLRIVLPTAAGGLITGALLFPLGRVTTLSGTTLSLTAGIGRTLLASVVVGASLFGMAAIGLFISTLTDVPVGAMAATVGFAVLSAVLDGVPQVASIHPWLFTHNWFAFGDLLRDPVRWTAIVHDLLLQLVYVAIFGAAAWARFTTKDVLA